MRQQQRPIPVHSPDRKNPIPSTDSPILSPKRSHSTNSTKIKLSPSNRYLSKSSASILTRLKAKYQTEEHDPKDSSTYHLYPSLSSHINPPALPIHSYDEESLPSPKKAAFLYRSRERDTNPSNASTIANSRVNGLTFSAKPSSLPASSTATSKETAKLRDNLYELETRISSIEKNIVQHSSFNCELRSRMQASASLTEERHRRCEQHQNETANVLLDLMNKLDNIQSLVSEKFDSLEKQVKETTAMGRANEETLHSLEHQILTLKVSTAETKLETEQTNKKVSYLSDEIATLHQKSEQLRVGVQTMGGEMGRWEREMRERVERGEERLERRVEDWENEFRRCERRVEEGLEEERRERKSSLEEKDRRDMEERRGEMREMEVKWMERLGEEKERWREVDRAWREGEKGLKATVEREAERLYFQIREMKKDRQEYEEGSCRRIVQLEGRLMREVGELNEKGEEREKKVEKDFEKLRGDMTVVSASFEDLIREVGENVKAVERQIEKDALERDIREENEKEKREKHEESLHIEIQRVEREAREDREKRDREVDERMNDLRVGFSEVRDICDSHSEGIDRVEAFLRELQEGADSQVREIERVKDDIFSLEKDIGEIRERVRAESDNLLERVEEEKLEREREMKEKSFAISQLQQKSDSTFEQVKLLASNYENSNSLIKFIEEEVSQQGKRTKAFIEEVTTLNNSQRDEIRDIVEMERTERREREERLSLQVEDALSEVSQKLISTTTQVEKNSQDFLQQATDQSKETLENLQKSFQHDYDSQLSSFQKLLNEALISSSETSRKLSSLEREHREDKEQRDTREKGEKEERESKEKQEREAQEVKETLQNNAIQSLSENAHQTSQLLQQHIQDSQQQYKTQTENTQQIILDLDASLQKQIQLKEEETKALITSHSNQWHEKLDKEMKGVGDLLENSALETASKWKVFLNGVIDGVQREQQKLSADVSSSLEVLSFNIEKNAEKSSSKFSHLEKEYLHLQSQCQKAISAAQEPILESLTGVKQSFDKHKMNYREQFMTINGVLDLLAGEVDDIKGRLNIADTDATFDTKTAHVYPYPHKNSTMRN